MARRSIGPLVGRPGDDRRGRGSNRSDSDEERPRQRPNRAASGQTDDRALTLRESGASFSAIASRLSLRRATDAHAAFVRALGRKEGGERAELLQRESARLDTLERRIRERDAGDPDKIERRLAAVTRLRELLP
jgi:hypothetical protein